MNKVKKDDIKSVYWEFFSPGLFEEDSTSFICSNCGMIIDIFLTYGKYTPKDIDYNYCPRCGCKMEDEERYTIIEEKARMENGTMDIMLN